MRFQKKQKKDLHSAMEVMGIPTAPGYEDLVAGFVRSWLRRLGIGFQEDRNGNLVARLRHGKNRHALAFSVHMDHPGFGGLKFQGNQGEGSFLGGVPRNFFIRGTRVSFFDRHGRLVGDGEVKKILDWTPQRRRIAFQKVSSGALSAQFGMWCLPVLQKNRRGSLLVSRVCDDLAGCAALLAALENLVRAKSKVDVYAVFTRREEVGLEGAFEVIKSRLLPRPVPVISIEMSKVLSNAPQGAGPIARVGDRSSVFAHDVMDRICRVGQALKDAGGFDFQRKLMDGGTCEATAYLRGGYPVGGICLALGNYHNCGPGNRIAAETIHLGDWNRLVQWIECLSKEFSK